MKADEDANGKTVVARAYAKGPIGHNTTVTAGRIPLLDTYCFLMNICLVLKLILQVVAIKTSLLLF
ncbi:hypothetical protein [Megamonas funiformis]|uniref:hypothetical protein n=1 Tax=Megamonas funiformis TaxID=437897 RepID=UPI001F0F5018|nr:hypothetical protein [Megamonas funiformis]